MLRIHGAEESLRLLHPAFVALLGKPRNISPSFVSSPYNALCLSLDDVEQIRVGWKVSNGPVVSSFRDKMIIFNNLRVFPLREFHNRI